MILDGFAGPGGWAEGLRLLGLSEVGLEWDASACATRVAAGHRMTIRCDVSQYPTAPFAGRVRVKVDSSPCQAWSRAGKGLGLIDQPLVHQAVDDLAAGRDTRAKLLTACADPRSLLAAEPMRWHHDLRPETLLMEQVPDVLPLWRQYAQILRSWGYSVWCGILCAADYGVPQTRRRAILIASRIREVTAPAPTHAEHPQGDNLFGPGLLPWVTMAQALGWGATGRPVPTVTAGGGKTGGAEPFPTQARAALLASQERGQWVLRTNRGGVRLDGERQLIDPSAQPAPVITTKTGEQWVLRSGQSVSGQGRAERGMDEPAVTITSRADLCSWVQDRPATTVCATDRIAPPGHRDRSSGGESQYASPDTVRITQAEAAILQSFPADYPWQGTKTKQFEQIGNAVPPLLAAHIAAAGLGIDLRERIGAAA
ncbi:DNA cytosine methyltransferase [Streptomyces sp. V4-01]|uniref:DNA (cytosine-5-)-methyltransferase n=1 Tax=Actinacidiphila polyblastidii TaxID=3110430 RepID=A0ABU7PKY6_9ACTN|nr:DNA cytosine methyltransferase [Streptomyces sp. V4-01]